MIEGIYSSHSITLNFVYSLLRVPQMKELHHLRRLASTSVLSVEPLRVAPAGRCVRLVQCSGDDFLPPISLLSTL
jgi:hypothetical protein